MKLTSALAVAGLSAVAAKTYMAEHFAEGWEKKWTVATEWKPADQMGEWKWTGGKYPGSPDEKGIQTSQDARFYSITAPLDAEIDNKGKDLIISYTVKHEQELDCGGAYIKLLPGGFDAKKFGGDTPYAIMFGPDVCGYSTRKTHVILTKEGKNHLVKKNVKCETDKLSHRYTLVLHADNSYEVQIDGKKVESGNIEEDWDILPPKTIKDPKAKKPADWVDAAQIPDPEDKKPEGYDNIPAKIPDPAAKKPEDWDDEEDGEWEAPQIDNPEYKGEWKPKMIANPAYKGPWVHPEIANPEYKADPELYHVCNPCSAVGFELWQVKSGTLFTDIMVSDSIDDEKKGLEAFLAKAKVEKAAFDKLEEAKKAADEAAKKSEKADEEDEDDDEEDDKDEL